MATNNQTNKNKHNRTRTTMAKPKRKEQNNVQNKSTFHSPTSKCFFQSIYIKYVFILYVIQILQLAFFFFCTEQFILGFFLAVCIALYPSFEHLHASTDTP